MTQTQYLNLTESLKRLPGTDFERHRHPAVLLDRATGPDFRVWGWWSGVDRELPCLLWAGELGWSATVVEPDGFDSEGYERVFWAHRVKLLDLALANAVGPCRTLEDLELRVASHTSDTAGISWSVPRRALLWGILQLRAARAHRASIVGTGGGRRRPLSAVSGAAGSVDEELVRYGLVPSLAKSRMPSLDAFEVAVGLRPLREAVLSAGRAGAR
jgi:hypothetical protein